MSNLGTLAFPAPGLGVAVVEFLEYDRTVEDLTRSGTIDYNILLSYTKPLSLGLLPAKHSPRIARTLMNPELLVPYAMTHTAPQVLAHACLLPMWTAQERGS